MAAATPSIEKLQKKLDKEPNPTTYLQLAEEYRKEGLYNDALRTCKEGLRKHPAYWSARVALGRIYHEMGDLEHSREELEKVIKAIPDNLLANKLLGDIYKEQNKLEDALKRYRIVQMLTPADQEVLQNIHHIESKLSGHAPAPAKAQAPQKPAPAAVPPPPPVVVPESRPAPPPPPVFEPEAQDFGSADMVSHDIAPLELPPLEIPSSAPTVMVHQAERFPEPKVLSFDDQGTNPAVPPEPAFGNTVSEASAETRIEGEQQSVDSTGPMDPMTLPSPAEIRAEADRFQEMHASFHQDEEQPDLIDLLSDAAPKQPDEPPSLMFGNPADGPPDPFAEPAPHTISAKDSIPEMPGIDEMTDDAQIEPAQSNPVSGIPQFSSGSEPEVPGDFWTGVETVNEEEAMSAEGFELEPVVEERPAGRKPEDHTQPMKEGESDKVDAELDTADELTTQTLAELYEQQGLMDKAVRVYQKLLLNDPNNQQIINKLKQLNPADALVSSVNRDERKPAVQQEPVRTSLRSPEPPATYNNVVDDRRRKISTLESWLATIRRERS